MPSYENLTTDELQKQRDRAEALLIDARDERSFIGKQTSMHIKVSELKRLDQDIERFQQRVDELDRRLAEAAS